VQRVFQSHPGRFHDAWGIWCIRDLLNPLAAPAFGGRVHWRDRLCFLLSLSGANPGMTDRQLAHLDMIGICSHLQGVERIGLPSTDRGVIGYG